MIYCARCTICTASLMHPDSASPLQFFEVELKKEEKIDFSIHSPHFQNRAFKDPSAI